MAALDDRRVLVIGASSGIGAATAAAIVGAGGRVAMAARRIEVMRSAATGLGNRATSLKCDVRSPEACGAVVSEAVAALGGLDAVVYCVGRSSLARLSEVDAEAWAAVLETNLVGAALVCRAALPHLQASGGRAVFFSSSSVGRPFPGLSAYGASKAGLEEMVRGWRAEYPGLCFACIAVGPTVGTDFAAGWDGGLAGEMFPVWSERGYLEAEPVTMSVDQVASVVVDVLASPICVQHTMVAGIPAGRDGPGRTPIR